MPPVLIAILRRIVPAYLWVYDRCLPLGPILGPVVLGYGPILLGICAFLVKSPTLDPLMGNGAATFTIFAVFALLGPLMHVGSKILAETLHKRRTGQWPRTGLVGFDTGGRASPTMVWVEMVRDWSKDSE